MLPPSTLATQVFGNLRVAVIRELSSPEVTELLTRLVGQGWRPRQLCERVGALPVQSTSAQDAEVIVQALRGLLEEESPQARYDAEVSRREAARIDAARDAPEPAAPEDRAKWISAIRSGLKGGRARVPFGPPVRLRPDCALCAQEAEFFVRRDVHLCTRCVDLLAAGEVKPEQATGT